MADDYFSFQSKKQRAGVPNSKKQEAAECEDPGSSHRGSAGIEVKEHDMNSTTIARRLKRFWFDKHN